MKALHRSQWKPIQCFSSRSEVGCCIWHKNVCCPHFVAGEWSRRLGHSLSTSRLVDWDSPQPAGQQPHTQTSPTLCQGQHLPPFNQLSVLGHWRRLIHPFLPKSLSGEYRVGVTTLGTGAPFVPHWSLECWSQILSRSQKAAALIYLAPLNWLNFSFFPLL